MVQRSVRRGIAPWGGPPARIGYRGSFLLFLAVLNGIVAWSLWHLHTGDILLPWQVWVVWWGVTGVIDAVQAFMRRDRIAFTMSAALKVAWGMVMLRQWLGNVPFAWLGVVIWWCFAALIAVVSGWPEPVPMIEPHEPTAKELSS